MLSTLAECIRLIRRKRRGGGREGGRGEGVEQQWLLIFWGEGVGVVLFWLWFGLDSGFLLFFLLCVCIFLVGEEGGGGGGGIVLCVGF